MKTNNSNRSLFFLGILVVCWLLIVSLAKDLGRVRAGYRRIDDANLKLEAEIENNIALKKKMSYAQSEYYKEKIVREKLNMQKPGEVVVVLPEEGLVDGNDQVGETENNQNSLKNWQKWWKILE